MTIRRRGFCSRACSAGTVHKCVPSCTQSCTELVSAVLRSSPGTLLALGDIYANAWSLFPQRGRPPTGAAKLRRGSSVPTPRNYLEYLLSIPFCGLERGGYCGARRICHCCVSVFGRVLIPKSRARRGVAAPVHHLTGRAVRGYQCQSGSSRVVKMCVR